MNENRIRSLLAALYSPSGLTDAAARCELMDVLRRAGGESELVEELVAMCGTDPVIASAVLAEANDAIAAHGYAAETELSLVAETADPARGTEKRVGWLLGAKTWLQVWDDTLDAAIECLRDLASPRFRPDEEELSQALVGLVRAPVRSAGTLRGVDPSSAPVVEVDEITSGRYRRSTRSATVAAQLCVARDEKDLILGGEVLVAELAHPRHILMAVVKESGLPARKSSKASQTLYVLGFPDTNCSLTKDGCVSFRFQSVLAQDPKQRYGTGLVHAAAIRFVVVPMDAFGGNLREDPGLGLQVLWPNDLPIPDAEFPPPKGASAVES